MQSAYEKTVTEPPGKEKEDSLDSKRKKKKTETLPPPSNTDRKAGNLRTDSVVHSLRIQMDNAYIYGINPLLRSCFTACFPVRLLAPSEALMIPNKSSADGQGVQSIPFPMAPSTP